MRRVGYKIPVHARQRRRRIDYGKAKGLVDWLSRVDFLIRIAEEEKGLVLSDRSTYLESVLIQLYIRLRNSLRIGEELVRIQRRVAQELKHRSVEAVGALPGGD